MPLKVKELASHFNISESKLRTLFKTELGSTVQDYIIERKIEEAKLMLRQYQDQALVRRSPFSDEQLDALAKLRDDLSK